MSKFPVNKSQYQPIPGTDATDLQKLEQGDTKKPEPPPKPSLSLIELLRVLTPYFWPASGSDGAFINRVRCSSTWLMVVLSKTSSLIAPFFISKATNYLVAGDFKRSVRDLIIFSSLKLASQMFKEFQSILYIKVKQQASIELQELAFSHLLSLSLNWHLSKKTGSVMKSMDRGVDAANSLISSLFLFLIPALLECLAVIILFFINFKQWGLGLIVFVGVVLYAMATIVITQWRKKFREQTNKHDNEFHDKATDSVINYETVKYFTGEAFEVARFKSSVVKYQRFNSSTQLSLSLLNISQQIVLNITLLCAMILSGYAVSQGKMTLGGWIAVQSWVATIFVPLNFLGSVYASIYQAFIDIRNLSELLSEQPDIVDEPHATDLPLGVNKSAILEAQHQQKSSGQNSLSTGASVEFRDIVFHYPEQPPNKGLKGVNFSVKPGTTTAIVGHTGAGKTTISRLLFRFYDPKGGAVLINDHDIKTHTQRSVRSAVGIVPQDTCLFNDTILYNISYGNQSATFAEVVAAAEAAQIRKFIESLPEKWETVVGERGLKLSGGEKQRVAIARCLLKNPPVVLLDEATSALDTLTENSIQEALVALGQDRTVLIIAHRLSTIRHAQQIVVLDAGRVAEIGTHDELIKVLDGLYSRMWAMQVHGSTGNSSGNFSGSTDSLSRWDIVAENNLDLENESSALVSSNSASNPAVNPAAAINPWTAGSANKKANNSSDNKASKQPSVMKNEENFVQEIVVQEVPPEVKVASAARIEPPASSEVANTAAPAATNNNKSNNFTSPSGGNSRGGSRGLAKALQDVRNNNK